MILYPNLYPELQQNSNEQRKDSLPPPPRYSIASKLPPLSIDQLAPPPPTASPNVSPSRERPSDYVPFQPQNYLLQTETDFPATSSLTLYNLDVQASSSSPMQNKK